MTQNDGKWRYDLVKKAPIILNLTFGAPVAPRGPQGLIGAPTRGRPQGYVGLFFSLLLFLGFPAADHKVCDFILKLFACLNSRQEESAGVRSQEEPGESAGVMEESEGVRKNQQEPGRARGSQEKPGGAPGGARRSLEAWRSQEEPGVGRCRKCSNQHV